MPPVDAPNVAGARAFGLAPAWTGEGPAQPDLSALRNEVEAGRVSALYVVDPGPEGSIGDLRWVIQARESGKLPFLIVQTVVLTPLVEAADVVLPGACWIEKDATYTNQQGRLQAASRVIPPPGEALDDSVILLKLAVALEGRPALRAAPRTSARTSRRRCRASRRSRASRRPASTGRSRRGTGCRRRTHRNAGSGTSCSRTCRR